MFTIRVILIENVYQIYLLFFRYFLEYYISKDSSRRIKTVHELSVFHLYRININRNPNEKQNNLTNFKTYI